MKKIVKTVQKQETVTVCDTCGKETDWDGSLEIDVSWSKVCPADGCFSDYGSFEFCSYDCFTQGVNKLTEEIDADEDFYSQSFTIRVDGRPDSDDMPNDLLPKILKSLAHRGKEKDE